MKTHGAVGIKNRDDVRCVMKCQGAKEFLAPAPHPLVMLSSPMVASSCPVRSIDEALGERRYIFIGSSLYVVGFLGVPEAILPHST